MAGGPNNLACRKFYQLLLLAVADFPVLVLRMLDVVVNGVRVDCSHRAVEVAACPELASVEQVAEQSVVVLYHHVGAEALEEPCDL